MIVPGATWDGRVTRFAVWSANARAIEVELGHEGGVLRLALRPGRDGWWVGETTDAPPGTRYGFRAHGPFDPAHGHYFNPAKLLLDPLARLIDGPIAWHEALRTVRDPRARVLEPDPRDSAPFLPRAVVVAPAAAPAEPALRTHWCDTVVYECHVRGLTMRHPDVPPAHRGTYLGLAAEPVIAHLRSLGVTAVQLMPVQHHAQDEHVARLGRPNYWGYAPVGFCAPDGRYATAPGRQVEEFRAMVRALHAAGIEVLLDVVFNHTGEGALDGPGVSLRGLDNRGYYRHVGDAPLRYEDVTGCGNTLDFRVPAVRALTLAALRTWVVEFGVDGFRFDLAPALGRGDAAFEAEAPFFDELRADPVLRGVKLIAEPWDLGPGGYVLGRFPHEWTEWNGRYRDTVRRFWRGAGGVADLATRLAGSSDLFEGSRAPQAGINFVTCHDGFTLRDLVSYERKHNEANGEGNRDGSDHNESRNWGVEGPTAARHVLDMRARTMRAFVATLACSLGVPMLAHGDEVGRTQRGNNNPWCQDSPLTWVPWEPPEADLDFLAFTRYAFALRHRLHAFRRRSFLPRDEGAGAAARWLRADGTPMTPEDWADPDRRTLLLLLALRRDARAGAPGESEARALLLGLNGGSRAVPVQLPDGHDRGGWHVLLESAHPARHGAEVHWPFALPAHGVALLAHR